MSLLIALTTCYPADDVDVPVRDSEAQLETELDQFIEENFRSEYQMAIRYRFVDRFIDPTRRVTPPRLETVRPMLDFIQEFWIDPYLEIENGEEFFREHVPVEIVFLGGLIFNGDGTVILGTADAGAQITFTNVNSVDPADEEWRTLQLQTVYHEFAHIVHQRYKLPGSYETITPLGYTSAGSWFILEDEEALQRCGDDDEPDLAPIEERVEAAISELRNELTAPSNGWRLNYKPTNQSGTFLILMDFEENGEVRVQSDVPDNDGEFLNQTITYRIDNSLGLELIFETFGVFHFLFELEDTQFGAEFEFLYQGKEGDNLIFTSKTDIFDETVLVFEPAQSSDPALFSAELAANLNNFDGLGPQVFGTTPTSQHVMLNDQDLSVFWSLDLEQRTINVEFAAEGTALNDILSGNNQIRLIDHETSYSLSNGRMVFEEPFSFVINNFLYEFEEMTFGEFENTGPSICPAGEDDNPIFRGQNSQFGDVVIQNTAISSSGLEFTENVYTINSDFIFD
ncbi:DUF4302 domain-containing protein, partial [Durusdinium trenchii]